MNTLIAITWLLVKATAFALALIAIILFFALVSGLSTATDILKFLIENWIVQTLIGAWVIFKAQQAVAASDRGMARLESAYSRKIDAITGLYSLIERRLYTTRRYLATIENDPELISEEREKYRQVVTAWNESAKIHQINLLLDYDPYFGLLLDQVFFPTFADLDRLLRRQRLAVQSGRLADAHASDQIERDVNSLSRLALQVTREMRKIADKDRKVLDGTVAISPENAHLVSYTQIFKALFVPCV